MQEPGIVSEARDFQFNNRYLSVRAAAFSEGWRIRVFEADQVATAVVYTVTHENTADPATASMHLVNELMRATSKKGESGWLSRRLHLYSPPRTVGQKK